MIDRDIYRETTAADDGDFDADGAEVVWLDDKRSSSWLDDFDFADYEDAEDGDRIGGLWSRYGSGSTVPSERILAAQKLVQGFVDTFATGDLRYVVTFDEAVKTAGTDFASRKVIVSHKPLFDPTITAEMANTVLTAMGCHEASHVRYGRTTASAAKPIIKRDSRAAHLSNILDDNRIELRFVADYPGYAGIFAPAIKYVAETETGVGKKMDPTTLKGTGLAGAAVRYAEYVEWTPETIGERDWWLAWAERWSRTDRGVDHVNGLEEGLAHLDAVKQQEKDQPEDPSGTPGASGDESRDESDEQNAPQAATGAQGESGSDEGDQGFPSCAADGIAAAAEANGADDATHIDPSDAQRLVEDAKSLVQDPVTGSYGDIYRSPAGIVRSRKPVAPNGGAVAAIRAAFGRSRTGHFATARGLKSGRVDNRSLTRIASSDHRLFAKRTAPSEGKYLVWLLVDCSSSMLGTPIEDASSVAASLAAAVRFLPNVTLDIWGWRTRIKFHVNMWPAFGAVRVYHSGEAIANIGYLPGFVTGGTPDAETLGWAAKAIREETPPGVEPVIILASDGQGSLSSHVTRGTPFVSDLAKRYGVKIVSVAFGNLDEDFQRAAYGERGYIGWKGSIARTAKPLGDLVARIASGHGA